MRQEYKLATFVIVVIIVLILATLIMILNPNKIFTGQAIEEFEHSSTKAICNETHCQDYEIRCKGDTLISQNPITGATIEKPENWTDPRNETDKDRLC